MKELHNYKNNFICSQDTSSILLLKYIFVSFTLKLSINGAYLSDCLNSLSFEEQSRHNVVIFFNIRILQFRTAVSDRCSIPQMA